MYDADRIEALMELSGGTVPTEELEQLSEQHIQAVIISIEKGAQRETERLAEDHKRVEAMEEGSWKEAASEKLVENEDLVGKRHSNANKLREYQVQCQDAIRREEQAQLQAMGAQARTKWAELDTDQSGDLMGDEVSHHYPKPSPLLAYRWLIPIFPKLVCCGMQTKYSEP